MKARILVPTFLLLFIGTSFTSHAQRWKRYRHEIGVGVGAANYMGDLGGSTVDENSRWRDFQAEVSRPSIMLTYKYRATERIAFRGNLAFGRVFGDDELAGNDGRRERNLHFRSNIIEFSAQAEYYFLTENIRSIYRIRGMRGSSGSNIAGYIFGGIGVFNYNPQAQDDGGDWVGLRELNTEGQGLQDAPDPYSAFAVTFPLGIGFKLAVNRQFSVGLEYGLRFTTTDYLDDVSGSYYNPEILEAEYGAKTVEMSDRRLEGKRASTNRNQSGIRGNPGRTDAYMFGMLTFTYKLRSTGQSRTRF